jgi:hypothetical protein
MCEKLTIDKVVEKYVALRDKKAQLENETKDKVREIKEKMLVLDAYIREKAEEQGVTSFKTNHGTAYVTTTDFAAVADWDAVLQFIKDNEAFDLLERRVSKSAVRGYLEETKEVPAGINYGTKITVGVRRPTNKEE